MPVTTVSHEVVDEFCTTLGYEPRLVRSIDIERGRMTVTAYRVDEHGRRILLDGSDAATSTDVIRVERRPSVLNGVLGTPVTAERWEGITNA